MAIEPWLARDAGKRAHYCDDPYFWEGWTSFLTACSGRPADAALRHLTFLLVKPEAIVGRRIAPMLEFLQSRGFRIIGTWPLRLGRHEVRSLWRYQLGAVPIAHIRVLEMVVTAGELFLLGLDHRLTIGNHRLTAGGTSAAELLSRSKGSSADPAGRDSLRDVLGRPALMLNFVHAPDEGADVLRELAVLCDAQQQKQVMATLLAASHWPAARFTSAARTAAETMTSRYAWSAAHDLDPAATLRRLRASLRDCPAAGVSPAACAAIKLGRTSPERAMEVVGSLESARELPGWDRIVTAVHMVDGLRTGRPPLIGPPPASAWDQHIPSQLHRPGSGRIRRDEG